MSGVALEELDRLLAGRRAEHLHAVPLEQAASARRCCARRRRRPAPSCRPAPRRSGAGARACAAWPAAGRRSTRCRNSAVSSSSRSGDCTPLSTMLFAILRSCVSSSARQLLAGEHDDRHVAQRRVLLDLARAARSRRCRAGAGRARRSRTAASRSASSASAPVPTVVISHVVVADQLDDAHAARPGCPRRRAAARRAARRSA